jgi:hypothetical protein
MVASAIPGQSVKCVGKEHQYLAAEKMQKQSG